MHVVNFIGLQPLDLDFLRCMDHLEDQTWRTSHLLKPSLAGKPIKIFNHGKIALRMDFRNLLPKLPDGKTA